MRSEFIPLAADRREVAAYRDAIMKAGVGVETTAEALDGACRHVTQEHVCISSDVVAAYPQAVNMIVHGGFVDESGRTLLVLPRDREAFRIVRDALADSHTTIPGFAKQYVEAELIDAIEATAAKLGFALGPRSTLTLPGWYTIFPTSGDDLNARRREARPFFDRDGTVVGGAGGKGGHISGDVGKGRKHAVIDIPNPAAMGLPGPCFLDAYLSDEMATSEVRPGLARVFSDVCWLEPNDHDHKWQSFWVYVPDYSERRWCALLRGERCAKEIAFKKDGRGKPQRSSCTATRGVKATRVSQAVLAPQPPAGWRTYAGLQPQTGHVHLWHREQVQWPGSSTFRTEFFYCPLCDAEAWPKTVSPDPLAYMGYGPAMDMVIKSVSFPADVRSAFVEDDQRGSYRAPGAWDKPAVGIRKQFKDAVAKAEKKFSKEIATFHGELEKLGVKARRKTPLSSYLELSERVAGEHGRRWKAPRWALEEAVAVEDEVADDELDENDE